MPFLSVVTVSPANALALHLLEPLLGLLDAVVEAAGAADEVQPLGLALVGRFAFFVSLGGGLRRGRLGRLQMACQEIEATAHLGAVPLEERDHNSGIRTSQCKGTR